MANNEAAKKNADYIYWICFIVLILVIGFLTFYKLDVKYVDPWDEARHGVNAYEMAHGGSLFQNTYLRQADYYNLKPPMSMYAIMLSAAIFGDGVFSLRFASAVCYILLAIAVGLFARRYGRLEALLAVAFLAVNTTSFQAHMIRSGDADSLYILLFTLAMLCMMRIKENMRNLYYCGFLFALAFLTKSFHAGVIAVIGLLYLILTGEIKKLKVKNWLLFLGSIILPILCWVVPRACVDGTAFFRAMWNTDVMGRTDGTLQSNIVPFWYYFNYFFGTDSGKTTVYLCAFIIIMIGIFVYPHLFQKENRSTYIGYVLWFAVPFLAFSTVSNKLLWYVYPTLIPLLMAAGILSARMIKNKKLGTILQVTMAAAVAVIILFYGQNIVKTINTQGPNEFQDLIKEAADKSGLKGCKVYVDYSLNKEEATDSSSGIIPHTLADWSQQDVYVAEAYGDFQCVNGGLVGLLSKNSFEDKPGLIFVGRDVYEEMLQDYEGDADDALYLNTKSKVAESDGYLVFKIQF